MQHACFQLQMNSQSNMVIRHAIFAPEYDVERNVHYEQYGKPRVVDAIVVLIFLILISLVVAYTMIRAAN